MLTPLKWKNEDQVGLLVATLAGAIFGVIAGGSLEHGWFNMLIWGLIDAVVVSGWIYWHQAFRQRSCPPLVASRHHGRLKNSTTPA